MTDTRRRDYFRALDDRDLLLHGKEALTYTDEYVFALIERFEDLLDRQDYPARWAEYYED